jgi:hypothetical protein
VSLTLVTAFFRLPDRRVDESAYFGHFDKLAACGLPIVLFLDRRLLDMAPNFPNVVLVPCELGELAAFDRPDRRPLPPHRSVEKDTRGFLLFINSKADLLERATRLAESSTHLAWIDFGVMKVARDPEGFRERLRGLDVAAPAVATPGCWGRGVRSEGVQWRFCGGFLLARRERVPGLARRCRAVFETAPMLTWEVNVWAEAERQGADFGWYHGDHDDSLVTIPASAYLDAGRV